MVIKNQNIVFACIYYKKIR